MAANFDRTRNPHPHPHPSESAHEIHIRQMHILAGSVTSLIQTFNFKVKFLVGLRTGSKVGFEGYVTAMLKHDLL